MKSVLVLATQYKPNIGGIQTYLEDFTKFLAKNDYLVDLITFKPEPISRLFQTKMVGHTHEEKIHNLKIKRIGYFDFGISTLLSLRSVIEFFLIINLFLHSLVFMLRKHNSIDIIHAHDYVTAAVALVLSKFFNKKWVMSHHSIFPYFKNSLRLKLGRAVISNASVIFANSESVKSMLEKGLGRNKPKIEVAHYWINHDFFRPQDKLKARMKLGLPRDAYVVMFVGRLEIAKGVGEFIKASRLRGDAVFVIVGAGEEYDLVKKNVGGKLLFLGAKQGEDLVDCYNAADVCCFPTVAIEAFGKVAVEALSCGTPVIVSATSTRELINDSVGIRTKPNAKDILKSVLSARRKFHNLNISKKCRLFAIKNYNDSNGTIILKQYERLIK